MRGKLWWLIAILVTTIVFGARAYWVRVADNSAPLASQTNSRLAPAFTLTSADGRVVSLNDWQGHIRLLNFWATWCVPCREEMPEIDSAYRTWQDQGFVVLSINEMDNRDAALEFAQNFRLTFPVLLDQDETVAKNYRVAGLPTSIFIDRDGVVRTVKVGAMDVNYIETQLAEMGLATAHKRPSLSATPTRIVKSDPTPASVPSPTQVASASTGRVDLDTLYPPDEGHDLVLEKCAGCHGIIPVAIVRRQMGGWAYNRATHEEMSLLTGLNATQIDSMYRYLNKYRNRDIPRPKIPQELLIECDG